MLAVQFNWCRRHLTIWFCVVVTQVFCFICIKRARQYKYQWLIVIQHWFIPMVIRTEPGGEGYSYVKVMGCDRWRFWKEPLKKDIILSFMGMFIFTPKRDQFSKQLASNALIFFSGYITRLLVKNFPVIGKHTYRTIREKIAKTVYVWSTLQTLFTSQTHITRPFGHAPKKCHARCCDTYLTKIARSLNSKHCTWKKG